MLQLQWVEFLVYNTGCRNGYGEEDYAGWYVDESGEWQLDPAYADYYNQQQTAKERQVLCISKAVVAV